MKEPVWGAGGRRGSIWVLLFVGWVVSGCFAQGRCLSSEDCPSGKRCVQSECRWECQSNGDCQDNFQCKEHQCVLPAGCQGCFFPHADALCDETSCEMGACKEGFFDIDQEPANGCEYACTPTSEATQSEPMCDGLDDDCDGVVDEGFDLLTDLLHCGDCEGECPTPDHAVAACVGGECRFGCEDGWFNSNGEADDGCESQECIPIVEPTDEEPNCDNLDDDCDGDVDEGYDKTSPETCGTWCVNCDETVSNATPGCSSGSCHVVSCDPGFVDVNEVAGDGCECEITNGGVEVCDGLDNDCNGAVDDSLNCCPEGMVQVDPAPDCVPEVTKPFCVDRYEASLWDSPLCDGVTGEAFGQNPANMWNCSAQMAPYLTDFPLDVGAGGTENRTLYACSLTGFYPARCISWYQARRACENSGKSLCSAQQWTLACQGKQCATYPYGDDFVWDVCNYINTFDDLFRILPSESMEGCISDYGAVDISGNIWEMDSSGNGHVRGGAFNCNEGAAPTLESCVHSQLFGDLLGEEGEPTGYRNNVGFRCCK